MSAAGVRALAIAAAAAVVTLAAFATPVSPVAAVTSPSPAPAHHRSTLGSDSAQDYFWQWSDRTALSTRTFIESQYMTELNLPQLIVTVEPAKPSHLVYLEFYQDGQWSAENIARTDADGVAVIAVDPFCKNATWCDGTYRYRLKIGGLFAPLSITYFED